MKLGKLENVTGIFLIPENMVELNAINAIVEGARIDSGSKIACFQAAVSLYCDVSVGEDGNLSALTSLRIVPIIPEQPKEEIKANESFELIDDRRRR